MLLLLLSIAFAGDCRHYKPLNVSELKAVVNAADPNLLFTELEQQEHAHRFKAKSIKLKMP